MNVAVAAIHLDEAHKIIKVARHRCRRDADQSTVDCLDQLERRLKLAQAAMAGAEVVQRGEMSGVQRGETFYPNECSHSAPACNGCESWSQFDPVRGSLRGQEVT